MRHVPITSWVVGILVLASGSASIDGGSAAAQSRYRRDAHGQPAHVSESWDIRGTASQPNVGTSNAMVRCGDRAFLTDRQALVRQYDLKAGTPLADIGVDDDANKLGRPWALAADCASQTLYVVDGGLKAVFVYRLPSGTLLKRHPLPKQFIVGRSAELVAPGFLYIGGLWYGPRDATWSFNDLDPEHFFDTLRFGVKLSLESGEVTTLFTSYEDRCISASSCAEVNLARIAQPGPPAWVFAQAGSSHIGLYDKDGAHTSSIDVSSPMFLRTGVELKPFTPALKHVQWTRENSEIDRVFGFGDVIAASHMITDVPADWNYGPVKYQVRLNLYSLDGSGLVSDISLPDRPIGYDAAHLYVVDYGTRGRQAELPSVRLLQIDIPPTK